jgi:hypothetical protein
MEPLQGHLSKPHYTGNDAQDVNRNKKRVNISATMVTLCINKEFMQYVLLITVQNYSTEFLPVDCIVLLPGDLSLQ